jgi:transposase
MSKRIFTQEQIQQLSKNENVSKCSEKSITYGKNFKKKAVKQYNQEGLISSEIFRIAGFDLRIIGRKTPKECLRRWNKIYQAKGSIGLSTETRGRGGGRPKKKYQTDKEHITYLETQVAYLKAENDFLAKLRAKRRE